MNDSTFSLLNTFVPNFNSELPTPQTPDYDYLINAHDIYVNCSSLPNQLNLYDQSTLIDHTTLSSVIKPATSANNHKSVPSHLQRMYAEKEQTLESFLTQMKTEKSSSQNSEYFFEDYEERSIKIVENPYSPLWYNSNQTMKHGTNEYYSKRNFNFDLGIVDIYNTPISNKNTRFYPIEPNQVPEVTCAFTHKQPHEIIRDKSIQSVYDKTDLNYHGPTFQPPNMSFYNSNNSISNEHNHYRCKDQEYANIDATHQGHYSSPWTTQESNPECIEGDKVGLSNDTTVVPLSHALVHDLHRAISSLYSTFPNKVSQLEKVTTLTQDTHSSAAETYVREELRNIEKGQSFLSKEPISSSFIAGNYTSQSKLPTYPVPAQVLKKVVHTNMKSTSEYHFGNKSEQSHIQSKKVRNTSSVPIYSALIKSKLPAWKWKNKHSASDDPNWLPEHDNNIKRPRPNPTVVVDIIREQLAMIRSDVKKSGLFPRPSSVT